MNCVVISLYATARPEACTFHVYVLMQSLMEPLVPCMFDLPVKLSILKCRCYSRPVEAASIGITPPLRNSPLCWLFWDGEFEAAEYLVAAGWDVAAEDWLHLHATVESQVNFMQRLLEYSRQPRPLIITCRDQIRKLLSTVTQGREILSQIDLLPLPNKLKDFLKLNDL